MSSLTPVEVSRRAQLKQRKPQVFAKVQRFSAKIKAGQSIAIVQFQYDYRCNFRCQHCSIRRFQGRKDARAFDLEDIRELSRQADELGLANFVLTGGEPLVFPDLAEVVQAIDPQKFYLVTDSNGWFLDQAKAQWLYDIGFDKVQLSLDSLNAQEHDGFRRAPGSHKRALGAIDACLQAGLNLILSTVVTHQRLHSQEFIDFLEFAKSKAVGTFVTYAKPVGAWEGNFEVLVNADDMDYMRQLEKKYDVFTHLTPSYGMDLGCIAVKRMISITQYGDVMPCPYIHVSLGNFFQEPLKDIIERGLRLKPFGCHETKCLVASDMDFINKYIVPTYGKELPVPLEQIFGEDDFLDKPGKLYR
ncbi:MAG: radical SAM protein [Oligosphaeraceae bacterium]|nr:radical SAM protein [Oligosphaeraceae bacterium]